MRDWTVYDTLAFLPLSTLLLPSFFFNDTATTEIYTLSLHDALPIYQDRPPAAAVLRPPHARRGAEPRHQRRGHGQPDAQPEHDAAHHLDHHDRGHPGHDAEHQLADDARGRGRAPAQLHALGPDRRPLAALLQRAADGARPSQ